MNEKNNKLYFHMIELRINNTMLYIFFIWECQKENNIKNMSKYIK